LGGIARDKHPERVSTLEMRAGAEAGHVVARMGMPRKEGNQFVKKLLAKYEKEIPNAPLGKRFGEIYDLERVTPTKEYMAFYSQLRTELKDMGLDYSLL
jgi:methylamine--corrinoid protein Co-methyltransferase